MPRLCKQYLLSFVSLILGLMLAAPAFAFDGWLPISPEDLAMKSFDRAPGAAAIILYRQVERDDASRAPHEFHYERIKILTEEGRKYADVEVPFNEFEVALNMSGLRGRTIHPDGRVVEFDGKVFDKVIVKTKDYKYRARTFTLPDVHAGDIIEYAYNLDLNEQYIFDSKWILSSELFTRDAKFILKPNSDFALRWSWPAGLPAGTSPPKSDDLTRSITMETHNIPALPYEDYMPPINVLRMRVEFAYSQGALETDAAKYWKAYGKRQNGYFEGFINKRGEVQNEVNALNLGADPPEVKAQKIYARVQQLKNLSFERQKSSAEEKRDKDKEAKNVGDVLKAGGGYARQLNYLFIAMARAAGLDATPVMISGRNEYFLNPRLVNSAQMNDDIVRLKLAEKDVYVDPGSLYAPFGLLSWPTTGTGGLALDRDGGNWIQTEIPNSNDDHVTRKAELNLTEEGSLEGTLTVTYSGRAALEARQEQRAQDETARKQYLEEEVKEVVPAGIEVTVTNQPEWKASTRDFVVEYKLKVPGWASNAGRRILLPLGVFGGGEKHMFEHADRVNNVYFHSPFRTEDDINITLPLNWSVASVPPGIDQDGKAVAYGIKGTASTGALHIARKMRVDVVQVDVNNYGTLRQFFQIVRTGDEQQAVLQIGK